ncbi:MAG: hypothetical protein R3B69_01815 [Candidatus Paceibacterota bacterium]
MLKQIMVPVAAFAVTVTTASAFAGTDWLNSIDVDLTDNQVAALEEAQEIREEARAEAEAVLEAAGLDEEKMHEIHEARHEVMHAEREAVHEALEAEDYDAFLDAIEGTPMADVIDSEADFEKFLEAHELREAGDHEAAAEILSDLGLERPAGGMKGGHGFGGPDRGGRQSAES